MRHSGRVSPLCSRAQRAALGGAGGLVGRAQARFLCTHCGLAFPRWCRRAGARNFLPETSAVNARGQLSVQGHLPPETVQSERVGKRPGGGGACVRLS